MFPPSQANYLRAAKKEVLKPVIFNLNQFGFVMSTKSLRHNVVFAHHMPLSVELDDFRVFAPGIDRIVVQNPCKPSWRGCGPRCCRRFLFFAELTTRRRMWRSKREKRQWCETEWKIEGRTEDRWYFNGASCERLRWWWHCSTLQSNVG